MSINVLTEFERALIFKIADRLPESERAQLLNDMQLAIVKERTADGALIRFDLKGYGRPVYRGQQSYSVDGRIFDSDGAEIAVGLFADENGRLLELELIRWDMGKIRDPQIGTLELY